MGNSFLWEKFLKGDKKAFTKIFDKYYDELYNYGLKLVGNHYLVEDSLQELFLKLWKNKKKLTPVKSPKPYLFKSFRHQLIDNINYNSRFEELDEKLQDNFDIEFSTEDFFITHQTEKETRERLTKALNKLTKNQKEAIYLRFFEGLSFEETAITLSINVQSVRNTIHRGMKVLRDVF